MAERYVQHLLSAEQRATHVLPPPIRLEQYGAGHVLAAKKDRTPLNEWKGLLPQEIVAITFTRKAASELRSRIRQRIQSLRAHPVKDDDRMGMHDPRLRHQGDVSMLMSLLESSPISTIDAFLSEILSPHIDLVAIHVSRLQKLPTASILYDLLFIEMRMKNTIAIHLVFRWVPNHHLVCRGFPVIFRLKF